LRIPDDISVAGFDNSLGNYGGSPGLTSFDPLFAVVAEAAALNLFDQIANPKRSAIPALQLVRGQLIEGTSVKTISSDEKQGNPAL
jgi:DNA-binding LacI/PurR family transcriptional regulator